MEIANFLLEIPDRLSRRKSDRDGAGFNLVELAEKGKIQATDIANFLRLEIDEMKPATPENKSRINNLNKALTVLNATRFPGCTIGQSEREWAASIILDRACVPNMSTRFFESLDNHKPSLYLGPLAANKDIKLACRVHDILGIKKPLSREWREIGMG